MTISQEKETSFGDRPSYSPQAIREELQRILDSRVFADAVRLREFLRYVVNESLAGKARYIKGYTVAQDVFHRANPDDAQTSTIVRVEAGRLRRRLIEYYAGEGRNNPYRIEIPKGAYVPRFSEPSPDGGNGTAYEQSTRAASNSLRTPSHRRPGILFAAAMIVTVSATGWWLISMEVESPSAGAARLVPTIVVLPFADDTIGSSGEQLASGLTEDVITDLSRIAGAEVIALSSTRIAQENNIDAAGIARDVGATHILRGSIRGERPNHRITAQLIESRTDRQVWAQRFDRNQSNMLQIQDEIARLVVQGLSLSLSSGIQYRSSPRRLVTDEARSLYRQAMNVINPPNDSSRLQVGRQAFERAIEIDSEYAGAYAGLAYSHVFAVLFRHSAAPDEDLSLAIELAKNALTLDASTGLAYTTLAFSEFVQNNFSEAIEWSAKAVAVQPGDPYINIYHAYLLAANGNAEIGVEFAERAVRLDPLSVRAPFMNILGYVSFYAGDFQKSLDAYLGSRARGGPSTPGHQAHVAAAYMALGDMGNASEHLVILEAISRDGGWARGPLTGKFTRQQDRELLASLIGEIQLPKER